MPKLIHVSTGSDRGTFIGVDEDGVVWRGRMERDQSSEFIAWEPIRSQFSRPG